MSQFFKQAFLASGRKQKPFEQMSQSFEQMLIFLKNTYANHSNSWSIALKGFFKVFEQITNAHTVSSWNG